MSNLLLTLVVLALLLGAGAALIQLAGRVTRAEAARDALVAEAAQRSAENARLEFEISHRDDDSVIEDYAREKLGYAYEDEQVFYQN